MEVLRVCFFWLVIILSIGAAIVSTFITDLTKDLSGLPLEGKIFCGIVVAIGVIYIVISKRQDSDRSS